MLVLFSVLGVLAFVLAVFADDGFNGSTLTFATSVAKLRSLGYSVSGNESDVSSLDDANMVYVGGIEDIEISATVVGVSSIAINDTGAVTVSWNDGSSEGGTAFTCICTGRDTSGDMNGEMTTSLTFRPFGG